MKLKELKDRIQNLSDDFEIEISVDLVGERPFNFEQVKNISVDIGYSDRVVHFFGDLKESK